LNSIALEPLVEIARKSMKEKESVWSEIVLKII
jgi:hypothetical protein